MLYLYLLPPMSKLSMGVMHRSLQRLSMREATIMYAYGSPTVSECILNP